MNKWSKAMKKFETKRKTIELQKNIEGIILDIGGGGEGVIGQLYNNQVIAIDNRQDELDDTPNGPKKVLMDASNLEFDDNVFDSATSFFTMMYIEKEKHKKVFSELFRVLKPKGRLYLWDTVIEKNVSSYQVFIIHLKILLPSQIIKTGYGVAYKEQDMDYYAKALIDAGFEIELKETDNNMFYIVAQK